MIKSINYLDVNSIVDYKHSDKVADFLVETGCYHIDLSMKQKDWFRWKSGIVAPCYCNCRGLFSTIEQRRNIVSFLSDSIKRNFPKADCVAGIATAGIPWASMVGLCLDLPIIYVRKAPKNHGISKRIEGNINNAENVVLIDDLIASGESVLDAIHVIQYETNTKVLGIQSIVNWGFEKMFELLGEYKICTLTSYEKIILSAQRHESICSNDVRYMLEFYKNPFIYDWSVYYEETNNL